MSKILILYHYYWPDDVVSATHYTDLCEGLVQRGAEVTIWPANRPCHPLTGAQRETHVSSNFSTKPGERNGVKIHRVWRPPFPQHSVLGRILNMYWMMKYWWLRLAFHPGTKPDVILVGTDPLMAAGIVPWLKLLRPKAKFVHWCFDLYPEAAVADNLLSGNSILTRAVRLLMKISYGQCGLVADIGSCMRERLGVYNTKKSATLTPWALEEPPHPLPYDMSERAALFGQASLCLLYSGNLGRAHEFYLTLKLARILRDNAVFSYSARGSRLADLKKAKNPEDFNLRFTEMVSPEKLSARLCAPDVHLVSLRPEWTGTVVPSKFFGALAVGRPVLFEGALDSSIARWIQEYGVGWVLSLSDCSIASAGKKGGPQAEEWRPANLEEVAEDLISFSKDEKRKQKMFGHCWDVYQAHFSKKIVLDAWNSELRSLLG